MYKNVYKTNLNDYTVPIIFLSLRKYNFLAVFLSSFVALKFLSMH